MRSEEEEEQGLEGHQVRESLESMKSHLRWLSARAATQNAIRTVP